MILMQELKADSHWLLTYESYDYVKFCIYIYHMAAIFNWLIINDRLVWYNQWLIIEFQLIPYTIYIYNKREKW